MRGVPDGSRLRGLDHVPLARPLLRRLFSCPVLISALRRWTSSASPADVPQRLTLAQEAIEPRLYDVFLWHAGKIVDVAPPI
jgi:hypothetical protein